MKAKKENVVAMPKQPLSVIMDEDETVSGYQPQRSKNILGRGWAATFMSGMEWMCRQDITGEQWRVWAFLMSRLDFDNWLRVKQKEICEIVGLKQANVSRALSRLVELDIITKGPMAGRHNTYRLNPRIAHRGAKHYKSNVVQYDELKRRMEARRR
jgi:DNA-binding MarR family transcriptional regulator